MRPERLGGALTPPILVVVLDTLRSDMLRDDELLEQLPTMRRLTHEAYSFSRAYAPSHWTLPSHASIFTGLSPNDHFARTPTMKLREDIPTLAEALQRLGYATACVTCNPVLSARFGMTRGFERVELCRPPSPLMVSVLQSVRAFLCRFQPSEEQTRSVLQRVLKLAITVGQSSPLTDNGARVAVRRAIRACRRDRRPSFVMLNMMEAHHPYRGRGRFRSLKQRIRNTDILNHWIDFVFSRMSRRVPLTSETKQTVREIYWENVRYLDRLLGWLLRNLHEDVLDRGFLIVLSDHGQLLGERDTLAHMAGLYEELVHVPLWIRPPGGTCVKRVDSVINLSSLFSLICRLGERGVEGLESWLREVGREDVAVLESHGGFVPHVFGLYGRSASLGQDLLAFRQSYDHPALACISGRWKLVCHLGRRQDELYHLQTDPREERNLISAQRERAIHLHEKLLKRISA